MGRYFGTDGIRGEATAAYFQPPFLHRLANALILYLRRAVSAERPLQVIIGRDPRWSGIDIARVLAEAMAECGVQVLDGGVAPTPAIARGVTEFQCDLGIVVTASHNPATDNGIKLFNREGTKFSEDEEGMLEELIDGGEKLLPHAGPVVFPSDAVDRYVEFATALVHEGALKGWKVAVDCAHGATAGTTPNVLRRLGAEVIAIGDAPDGYNINDGVGSEHPERLQALVTGGGCRIGIAHDGDGDRLILVDEKGATVPGDAVLGFVGQHLVRSGLLARKTVVATVMSNLGLDRALAEVGGQVRRTAVGDRQVFYAMQAEDLDFGGESSGHLIFRRVLPTGDGLVAALMVIQVMLVTGRSLSDLAASIPLYPQRTANLRVREKKPLRALPELQDALDRISADLGDRGRILVRYSGTEPKVRLLAEAENAALADNTLGALTDEIGRFLDLE